MNSRTIRVDKEVYERILEAKARLEVATGSGCSMGYAVRFLVAMSTPSDRGRPVAHEE